MKKIAYLECPTGIAGDMCLGALVHAGVPLDYLKTELAKLGLGEEYHLWAEPVHHNGQLATKVHVDLLLEEALDHHHSKSSLDHHKHNHEPNHIHSLEPDHEHSPEYSSEPDYGTQLDRSPTHSLGEPQPPHDHGAIHEYTHQHNQEDKHGHNHDSTHRPHRHLPEITKLIQKAGLPPRARDWSLAVFHKLAIAEGTVHGISPDLVHFHEVGATDAIVDIVGTCLGLDWLGIEELYCSALPTGGGTVWAEHGRLPVPVPAVLQLWQDRHCPVYSNGINRELVTPTGAALAVTLAQDFGQPPAMNLHKVGLGAGTQQLPIPNILRLWLGEKIEGFTAKSNAVSQSSQGSQSSEELNHNPLSNPRGNFVGNPANDLANSSTEAAKTETTEITETIAVLETQIDDLSPQAISYACDRLFQVGALDVFTQGITMKKSRLGTLLTVITPVAKIADCEQVLFQETSTLGIRRSMQTRSILHREIQPVTTEHGLVRVKVAWQQSGQILNVQPEYEDCAAIARSTNLPLREIQANTLKNWSDRPSLP
jgi:uncharacterized protein (TIGR00299 family) protein